MERLDGRICRHGSMVARQRQKHSVQRRKTNGLGIFMRIQQARVRAGGHIQRAPVQRSNAALAQHGRQCVDDRLPARQAASATICARSSLAGLKSAEITVARLSRKDVAWVEILWRGKIKATS